LVLIINSPDNRINGIIFIFSNVNIPGSKIENIKKLVYIISFGVFTFILLFNIIKFTFALMAGLLLALLILPIWDIFKIKYIFIKKKGFSRKNYLVFIMFLIIFLRYL
jgi:hypothetical protein